MKSFLCLVMLLFLYGCGTTVSEVVPAGKDTFYISGHGYSKKGPEAMTELYKEANGYCSAIGKHFLPVSSASEPFDMLSSSVQLHFRCLLKDDPEYKRPTMKQNPDTLIEIKPHQ